MSTPPRLAWSTKTQHAIFWHVGMRGSLILSYGHAWYDYNPSPSSPEKRLRSLTEVGGAAGGVEEVLRDELRLGKIR